MIDSRADALACERITRRHARTFSLASRLLPLSKRRAAFALYAFCRVADDLVDQAEAESHGGSSERLRAQLQAYEAKLVAAIAGQPSDAVFREVARVLSQFDVPSTALFELLRGVARDLDTPRYHDWAALQVYCEGVASSVGEMCTHVFGVSGSGATRTRAVQYARTLGVAMQLTNILRDVGEDARRGRCYLPEQDLARFGLSAGDVLEAVNLNAPALRTTGSLPRDERWTALMVYQVQRARALYAAAVPGIALLAPDAQRCAMACATGYAGILNAIEAQRYDTISSRARLGQLARVGILWNAWRHDATVPDVAALAEGPRVAMPT